MVWGGMANVIFSCFEKREGNVAQNGILLRAYGMIRQGYLRACRKNSFDFFGYLLYNTFIDSTTDRR